MKNKFKPNNRNRYVIAFTCILFLGLFSSFAEDNSFQSQQLNFERVATARKEKENTIKELCKSKGIAYPLKNIYLRVFKDEQELEVWALNVKNRRYVLLKQYDICAIGSKLGPKREQGDGITPEGFYYISVFNPQSNFYISLGLNYPNISDKIKSGDKNPGGDIFIHGNCVSIGCMAMKDHNIKEIYWMAVLARNAGQNHIPVSIFPYRFIEEKNLKMERKYAEKQDLLSFWNTLKPGYDHFESRHTMFSATVDKKGKYTVQH